jgi:hypothetical protein
MSLSVGSDHPARVRRPYEVGDYFDPPWLRRQILSRAWTKADAAREAGVGVWVIYDALAGGRTSDRNIQRILRAFERTPAVVDAAAFGAGT